MKQLSIVRHAHAEHFSQHSDFDRVLTEPGRTEARLAAEKARLVIAVPELILASPAARTLETARIFADVFGIAADSIVTDRSLYGAGSRDLRTLLEKLDSSFRNVMLVGHNPEVTELASGLTPSPVPFFKPATILTLELDIDCWDRLPGKAPRPVFLRVP